MGKQEIKFNEEKKRFEMDSEGHIAFIDYKLKDGNVIVLTHTEVPPELEGRGIGKKLVEKTLEYLRANNFKLVPLCPFVAAYIKRNAEWESILAPKQ